MYLDELGGAQSVGLAALQLTVTSPERVREQTVALVRRARAELEAEAERAAVLDLLETIVVGKLPQLSREEVAAMFELEDLKKTRFYQEVKAEGL